VATWAPTVPSDDRDALDEMLRQMGSDVAGSFPEGVDVKFIQAAGEGAMFEKQADWAERKLSIAWLGQTLTTEHQGVGSFALGKVHDHVRADLLAADLKAEARALQTQLLGPMAALRFPDREGPAPVWRRVFEPGRDLDGDRLGLEQLKQARDMGLPLQTDEVYARLDFTRPTAEDADVMGGATPATPASDEGAVS
jgi:phage gp29-like protein